jgi:hypothetical protein
MTDIYINEQPRSALVESINGRTGDVTIEAGNESVIITSNDNHVIITSTGGSAGPKGDKGDTGDKGDKGDKGDTGAAGMPGVDGSFENLNGDVSYSGELSLKGEGGVLITSCSDENEGGTLTWRSWNETSRMIQNIIITNTDTELIFTRANGSKINLSWGF